MSLAPTQVAPATATTEQGWRRWATPQVALLAIAGLYSLVVLTQLRWFDFLAFDEVVYTSQFAHGAHPMNWSAPRSWGMPLLLAPVDMLTTSIPVLRLYLGILAGACLYLAFHPWLRVSARWVAPVAAGLFVTLWTSVLYGVMGYPNLWMAFAFVAAFGWASRAVDDGGARVSLAWLVALFAIASLLIRPSDAAIVALPVLGVLIAKRATRPLAAVAGGLSIGVVAWVVESFVRFGDPINRLREGAQTNDPGLSFSFMRLLEAVDGPQFLCRATARCADVHVLEVLWWLALPLLAVLGVVVAHRRWPYLMTATGAALLVATYAILLDWTNTRYLQPAYALVAIPVARAVLAGLQARRAVAVLVVALLVGHVAMQLVSYNRAANLAIGDASDRRAEVALLRDTLGVAPPCIIFQDSAPTVPYSLGCRIRMTSGQPSLDDPEILEELGGDATVVAMLRGQDGPPVPPAGWRVEQLSPGSETYILVHAP